MSWRLFILTSFAFVALTIAAQRQDEKPKTEAEPPDALLFRQAKVGTDAKSLLAFLRGFCPTAAQQKRLPLLIEQLGDDDAGVRDDAEAEIRKMGPAAAPALSRALPHKNAAVVRAARRCLGRFRGSLDPELHEATARRLALAGNDDAIAVLLAYLPAAPDDGARETASAALATLHRKRKAAAPAVLDALKDGDPARRATAARALSGVHAGKHLDTLKALTKDVDDAARYEAACALVRAADRAGVAPLVALLEKAPLPVAWRAEELLIRIAGAKAPPVALQGRKASREACHVAWAKWWKEVESKTDLASVPTPRKTHVAYVDVDEGWLVGLDSAWKESWKMEGLHGPTDAQFLPSGRVLIAENWGGKVTERDAKGKVVWEHKPANYPISCWRLDSGNTVTVSRKDVSEVTPEGKAVWTKKRSDEIRFGLPLRGGRIALRTGANKVVTLEAEGQQIEAFEYDCGGLGNVFSTLPGGRFLVANAFNVFELDRQGRPLHELGRHTGPGIVGPAPLRLDDGATVVVHQPDAQLVLADRKGEVARTVKTEGRVWRVLLGPR